MQDFYRDGESIEDKDIKKMMDHYYSQDYLANSAFWSEAAIDKRFKIGDQNLLSSIYGDNGFYSRRRFFFNLIRRNVNMIAGYQRQNRKSSSFVPIDQKDQQLADDYTKLSMWSERREGFHEYFSQAFEGAVDTGLYMMELTNDYSMDAVSGELKADCVAYNDFMIDPNFKKQDLSDCNFIWRRTWLTKEKAKQFLPGMEKEIEKMNADGMKDGRFPIQAEYMGNCDNLFTCDQFHYASSRECILVVDTKTGEVVEWEENPDDEEDELERTLSQQPWLKIKKTRKPTTKLAILLGGRIMYHGPNLLNVDRYPFVPLLCYDDPSISSYAARKQGIIRNLRDAQYLYNRRRIIELDIMESTINSGYKYKVGAVTDENCFRQTGQGFLIPVNRNAEMSDVERIDPPGIPASMIELSRSLAEDITKISGISEELLGAADDDKSGILSMLRQGANLVSLQTIFDKADYSQKLFASLRAEAIRKNWSNGKIQKILGRKPDPSMRLSSSQKFDVAVEQGAYSTTQQQMELKQLIYFRELGIQSITDQDILNAATIQNKGEILERQKLQDEQQQQQQEAMMMQQQEQQANQKMMDFAKAQKDMASMRNIQADTTQKISEIEETQASAEEKRTQSDLNIVKQMIELEDMDLRQLKDSIELASVIKQQQELDQIINYETPEISKPLNEIPGQPSF
jgi:hypothetical protein